MGAKLTLSLALEGFLHYKAATGRSEHTLADYRNTFKKLQTYFPNNPLIASITREQLIGFFAWLQNDYVSIPDGVAPRGEIRLAAKSVFNIHANLAALWAWATNEELVKQNWMRKIEPPRVAPPVIEPFTREEIQALLKACETSRSWKTRNLTTNKISTANRSRAIVLMLLDTGARASELCGLCFGDLNFKNNSAKLRGKGPGPDGKERLTYFSKRTAQAVWKCLLPRLEGIRERDPVFVVGDAERGGEMGRNILILLDSGKSQVNHVLS
jgi:site-specific recombinase XerD